MEHSESEAVAAFDTIYTNNHIQILKVLLPYFDMESRKNLAVMIKYLELQYTMEHLNRHPAALDAASFGGGRGPKTPDIIEIFSEIKNFCTPSERSMIEQLANMRKNMEMYQEMMNMMKLFQELAPASGEGGGLSDAMNLFGFGQEGFGGGMPFGESEGGGMPEQDMASFGNPLDMLKGMLSPEQQSMFDMFQSSFGTQNNSSPEQKSDN